MKHLIKTSVAMSLALALAACSGGGGQDQRPKINSSNDGVTAYPTFLPALASFNRMLDSNASCAIAPVVPNTTCKATVVNDPITGQSTVTAAPVNSNQTTAPWALSTQYTVTLSGLRDLNGISPGVVTLSFTTGSWSPPTNNTTINAWNRAACIGSATSSTPACAIGSASAPNAVYTNYVSVSQLGAGNTNSNAVTLSNVRSQNWWLKVDNSASGGGSISVLNSGGGAVTPALANASKSFNALGASTLVYDALKDRMVLSGTVGGVASCSIVSLDSTGITDISAPSSSNCPGATATAWQPASSQTWNQTNCTGSNPTGGTACNVGGTSGTAGTPTYVSTANIGAGNTSNNTSTLSGVQANGWWLKVTETTSTGTAKVEIVDTSGALVTSPAISNPSATKNMGTGTPSLIYDNVTNPARVLLKGTLGCSVINVDTTGITSISDPAPCPGSSNTFPPAGTNVFNKTTCTVNDINNAPSTIPPACTINQTPVSTAPWMHVLKIDTTATTNGIGAGNIANGATASTVNNKNWLIVTYSGVSSFTQAVLSDNTGLQVTLGAGGNNQAGLHTFKPNAMFYDGSSKVYLANTTASPKVCAVITIHETTGITVPTESAEQCPGYVPQGTAIWNSSSCSYSNEPAPTSPNCDITDPTNPSTEYIRYIPVPSIGIGQVEDSTPDWDIAKTQTNRWIKITKSSSSSSGLVEIVEGSSPDNTAIKVTGSSDKDFPSDMTKIYFDARSRNSQSDITTDTGQQIILKGNSGCWTFRIDTGNGGIKRRSDSVGLPGLCPP